MIGSIVEGGPFCGGAVLSEGAGLVARIRVEVEGGHVRAELGR